MKYSILSLIICSFIFVSCSIESRKHLSGYHINWKGKSPDLIQTKNTTPFNSEFTIKSNLEKKVEINSNQAANPFIEENKVNNISLEEDSIKHSKCDTLSLKNGTRILAKITEIGLTEIKYKNCNNIDGPTIVVSKKNTKSITYKDGSKELIIYDSNPEKPKKKKFDFIGLASFVLSVFTVFLCINFIGVISSTELFLAIALLGIAAIALGSYSLYLYFNKYRSLS